VNRLKNLNELISCAERIIRNIDRSDKVCVIHHDDADGNCSAALFSILIHGLTGDYPVLFPVAGTENVNKRLIRSIKTINPDYVFVLDVIVEPQKLDSLKGFVLDHHFFSNIEQRNDMPYFNPRYFEKMDEKVPPVSYMVYRILKNFFPTEKVAWIAGIGITEDHRVDLCKDVFEEVKKETPELLKMKVINQKNVEKSLFGELWDMVRSGRMLKGREGARTAVLALIECKDRPDKLVNGLTQHSLVLRRFYEKLSYEMQDCLRDVEKRGKFFKEGKVIIYKQKKMRIRGVTSYLADKIRQKYPKWIAYVINEDYGRGRAKISIRLEQTERKENLVRIIEKIKEKIPSVKGGGHKSAVGVILSLNDVIEFEEEFLNSIK
jgi:single-stranded DNA-specific DHH superfamily exonuclease